VRDVIGFRGQTWHFLQRAHEVKRLPPVAVLWGERDTVIPIAQGRRFVEHVNGAVFKSFADCGHYLHQDCPAEFVRAVREFLDAPHATPVTLREATRAPRAQAGAMLKAFGTVARSFQAVTRNLARTRLRQ
jgi:hypothetical protein